MKIEFLILLLTFLMSHFLFGQIVDSEDLIENSYSSPESIKGQTVWEKRGFRMYGIREGEIYEQMGIKDGDLLVEWNGKKLTREKDLKYILESFHVGKFAAIVIRNGKKVSLKYPTEGDMISPGVPGFVVESVEENGFFEEFGIKKGDLIIAFNGRKISKPRDFEFSFGGKSKIEALVQRNYSELVLKIDSGAEGKIKGYFWYNQARCLFPQKPCRGELATISIKKLDGRIVSVVNIE